jgi:hypothetical protein
MMRFTRLRLGVLALALLGAPASAADDHVWTAAFVNGPAAKDSRVLLWFDAHARFSEFPDDLSVTILRPGIGWRTSHAVDLWAGYARVVTRRAGSDLEEDRLWQQSTYGIAKPLGGTLTGRTRLEQRFRGGGTGWRLRQWLRFGRPIEGTPFALVASNELFYGLNSTRWGQRDGFDQNRAFVGGAWQAAPRLRAEAGYLNHHVNGGPAPDRTMHNLSISAYVAL